jgi:hypothetical protein
MSVKARLILFVMLVLTALTWNLYGVGRAQSRNGSRFDYLRVTPYLPDPLNPARVAYRACVAASTEWTCREFESKDSPDAPLRTTLATLGQEGWELVSAVDETPDVSLPDGLTYLFKRQSQ